MSSRQLRTTTGYGRLSAALTSNATTMTVTLLTGAWPDNPPFNAALGDGTSRYEVVQVTAINGATWTIARAQEGTLATSHPQDESVTAGPTQLDTSRLLGFTTTVATTPATNVANLTSLVDMFAPPSLPGLHLWYAADRITGLTDGAAVASWADLSGNGLHAEQATAANRPLYKTGIINNLPALLFDGSNDDLRTAAFTARPRSTILVVAKASSTSGSRNIVDGVISGRHQIGIRTGAFEVHQGSGGVTAGPTADTNPHVFAGTFAGSASTFLAVDGTAAAASSVGTHSITQLYMGGSSTGSERYVGYIAELVMFNRVLTTAERQQLEWYLATKYSLATASTFVPAYHVTDVARVSQSAKITVADRGLWVSTVGSDDNDGLSGGSAKLTVQAALDGLDTAGGGEITVLGGTYTHTAELTANTSSSKPMKLRGMGTAIDNGATILLWSTDLGAGKFAIRPTTAAGTYNYLTLEGLRIRGPGPTSGTYGEFPANMDGVQLDRRVTIRDCQIRGFRSGVKVTSDHNRMERVATPGNGYGVYFEDMTSYGDHMLYDCDLSSSGIASIAIGTTGNIQGATMLRGHLGFAPYCILIEDGQDPANLAMGATLFINVSFEAFSHGAIVNPDMTAHCVDVALMLCGDFSHYNDFDIAGEPNRAIIQAGLIKRWQFYHCMVTRSGNGTPVPTALIRATEIQGLRAYEGVFLSAVDGAVAAGMVPFQAQVAIDNRFTDRGYRGLIAKAHASSAGVNADEVVSWAGAASGDHVFPYAGAYAANQDAQVVGVARTAGPASASSVQDLVVVLQEGFGVKVATSSATPSPGTELMSDPANRNKVVAMDGRLDLPHLGHASGSQSGTVSGTSCNIDLHIARSTAIRRKTVTGSRGGNAALADLLSELSALGIITDSSSA